MSRADRPPRWLSYSQGQSCALRVQLFGPDEGCSSLLAQLARAIHVPQVVLKFSIRVCCGALHGSAPQQTRRSLGQPSSLSHIAAVLAEEEDLHRIRPRRCCRRGPFPAEVPCSDRSCSQCGSLARRCLGDCLCSTSRDRWSGATRIGRRAGVQSIQILGTGGWPLRPRCLGPKAVPSASTLRSDATSVTVAQSLACQTRVNIGYTC